MKNCIYCLLMASIVYGQISCGDASSTVTELPTPSESSLDETLRVAEAISLVKEDDENVEVKGVLFSTEQQEIQRQEQVLTAVDNLKQAYQQLDQPEGSYIEEVALPFFLGEKVEMGALEINVVTDSFTRIHADYFNGEPVGGKLFLVLNGKLMAIEIVTLTKKMTESGEVIVDNITHIFYYENDQLFKVLDSQNKQEVDFNEIAWTAENLKDWNLVKAQLPAVMN